MRFLLLLLMVLPWAAAADGDLLQAATNARAAAEADLAATRTRLADERRRRAAELMEATAEAAAARKAAETTAQELAAARIEAERRRSAIQDDAARARGLADRALAASQATSPSENPPDRAAAAIAANDRRLAALPAALADRRETLPVIDRHGRPLAVPVRHLGSARSIALGPDDDTRGLLLPGSPPRIAGPLLPATPGVIALDPTGQAAQQPPRANGFLAWLAAGRLFIWPILGVFLVALGILVVRARALARIRVDPALLGAVADHLAAHRREAATALVAERRTPLARVLHTGLAAHGRSESAREALVEEALVEEAAHLHRGAAFVLVLAGICPLLGLLGTVTGMIDLFAIISTTGSGAARNVSGGISEALVTTQAGMLTAIPLLIGHAVLARAAERREQLLEQAACRVLGLLA